MHFSKVSFCMTRFFAYNFVQVERTSYMKVDLESAYNFQQYTDTNGFTSLIFVVQIDSLVCHLQLPNLGHLLFRLFCLHEPAQIRSPPNLGHPRARLLCTIYMLNWWPKLGGDLI